MDYELVDKIKSQVLNAKTPLTIKEWQAIYTTDINHNAEIRVAIWDLIDEGKAYVSLDWKIVPREVKNGESN